MAELVTRAVITAHDRLTGPLGAMAKRVRAINGQLAGGARAVGDASRRASSTVTAGGIFGLGFALSAAKDFEKRMFGIGVATIPDAMGKGENAVRAASSAMGIARDGAIDLSKELGQSMGTVGEIMESGVKGGMPVQRIEDFSRAIGLLRLTDPDASAETLAGWGVAIDALYERTAKASGMPWGEWFKKQADIAAVAAAETQLSTGTFIEGMRQFQALHAAIGVPNNVSAALLASGVKAGQNSIEVGQTLKSNALRVMVPTLPNLRAWNAAGLNRSDYLTGEQFINDPMKVAGAISQLSGGAITGKNKTRIQQALLAAQQKGVKASDPVLFEQLTRMVAKGMGLDLRNEENRERITDILGTAMFSGREVDMERLYKDIVEKKVDPAKVAQMFEGRRVATNMAILSQLEGGFYDQTKGKFAASDGKTLEDTQKVFDESWYGKIVRMEAAISRLNVRLMTSPGITAFVEGLSGTIEKLDALSPRVIEFGANALLLGLAAGPLMRLASGIGSIALGMKMAGTFMKRLMGGGFAALGNSMKWLATGFGALAMRGGSMAGLFGVLGKGIGIIGRFATPLGWITTGVCAAYEAWKNWDTIKGYADDAIKSIAKFFGFEIKGSPIGDSIDWLMGKLQPLVDMIQSAIDKFSELTGIGKGGEDKSAGPKRNDHIGMPDGISRGGLIPQAMTEPRGPAVVEADRGSLAAMGSAIADAVRSALANVNINVNGAGMATATRGGASAPAPRTQNGGLHNGGN